MTTHKMDVAYEKEKEKRKKENRKEVLIFSTHIRYF
jgi:hypothetical protein